jgi:hypothetical protein
MPHPSHSSQFNHPHNSGKEYRSWSSSLWIFFSHYVTKFSGQHMDPISKGQAVEPTGGPETSTNNHQSTLCNIPEDRKNYLKCIRWLNITDGHILYTSVTRQ